jgi:hypothetical protein
MLSYDLLLKLLLKHKSHSHSSSLSELLPCTITLTNISNIIKTEQTKHIKDEAEAPIIAEAFEKASKATVALEAVAVFRKAKTVANISYYLHIRKSVIFIISQVAGQQSTFLKSKNKYIISLVNILLIFIKHPQPYITKAF